MKLKVISSNQTTWKAAKVDVCDKNRLRISTMPHYLKQEAPESHGAHCNGVEDRARIAHKQLLVEAQ